MTDAIELRINKKISKSFLNVKDELEIKIDQISKMIGNMDLNVKMEMETLKEMLNESKIEKITQEDLLKRKRVKNFVPYFDRCIGKKSNGEQCTRKRRPNSKLCGTHEKGVPHGVYSVSSCVVRKVNVYAREIKGIVYYLDEEGNVYDTNDVHNNIKNPRIIATSIDELK
jgi:hypothetical protein